MSRRKWLVRGLVFSVLGGLALAALLYERWTNPLAVRQQVIVQLEAQFPGARVSVHSAQWRLLGGIAVQELRLSRRDNPDKTEFAYVSSAIIYHDKEQLSEGRLVCRKMELHRPRLRVVRRQDGSWNLAGLLGVVNPDTPIPTLVIEQGTIILEDQLACPDALAVEIHDVNLTLINDPLDRLTFRAEACAELTGTIQTSGTYQRVSGETTLSLQIPALPIKPILTKRVAAYCPELGGHVQQLEGQADLRLDLGNRSGIDSPWSYDLSLHLTEGQLRHPQLPLVLSHLEGMLRCRDGQLTLDQVSAQAGQAFVRLSDFKAQGLSADADLSGLVKVEHLPLCPDFFGRLPAALQSIQEDFRPAGPVNLTFGFARRANQWSKHCIIEPLDLTAVYRQFPYQLDHLTGKLDYELDPARKRDLLVVDLLGYAGSRPLTIRGSVEGEGAGADIRFDIRGTDLPLDRKLLQALPITPEVNYQELAESFHAAGRVDFVTTIRHVPGSQDFANRHWVRFHDASMHYQVFDYPLENVSGILEILPEYAEFRDFHGTHKGGMIWVRGRADSCPEGSRVVVHISGSSILLDDELEAKLSEQQRPAWASFRPSGRIDFVTQVTSVGKREPDIDLTVTAHDCAIRPIFFKPYELTEVNGSMRYARGWVALGKFGARHGPTTLSLDEGFIYLKPAGGIWARLTNIQGTPIIPDAAFLQALPPALGKACTSVGLHDPVTLRTQLVIDSAAELGSPLVIYWDGEVGLQDATLQTGVELDHVTGRVGCLGLYNGGQLEGLVGNVLLDDVTVFKQPLRAVHGQFEVRKDDPGVLLSPGLQARVFGGQVGGPVRIEFGPTLRYELNLTALGIHLEEAGRHNLGANAQVSGLASGRLWLRGQGADLQRLEGKGSLDIPSGRLYNLPVLLDLLKVPGLRLPDRTAFEEAHASFSIQGSRVLVDHLDLFGNAVSLGGKGEMNLDGTDINLDFYAVWGRVMQMLPPLLNKIPPAISEQLLKIKMRGSVGNVKYTNEPVPVVVEPIKEMLEQMSGRSNPNPRTVPP